MIPFVAGGHGLLMEYYKDVDKTSKALVFCEELNMNIYRTGDLGRVMPDGNVEILGRIDFQVKVNGYRIETGEVEAAMKTDSTLVKDAFVLPIGPKGKLSLIGFVLCTSEEGMSESEKSSKEGMAKMGGAEAAALAGLEQTVPKYMHPSVFHMVLEWPMTANGKLDRKALEALHKASIQTADASEAENAMIQPRNSTEQKLWEIWSEVLGMDSKTFGVTENFNEIGGTSISMISMGYKVRKTFNSNFGFHELLSMPTISAFARYLSQESVIDEPRRHHCKLVPFNSDGSGIPFFCVAPVSGQVHCYRGLSKQLGSNQPFYSIQHSGLYPGEKVFDTVEEMAADMVLAVQQQMESLGARSMNKPFQIAGWSFGGILALEIALQLQAAGTAVHSVVLFDTPAPTENIQIADNSTGGLLSAFANDLSAFENEPDLPTAGDLDVLTAADASASTLTALQKLNRLPNNLPIEDFTTMFNVYQNNLEALCAYKPNLPSQPLFSLHQFRATETNNHLQMYPGHIDIDWGFSSLGFAPSKVLLYLYTGM